MSLRIAEGRGLHNKLRGEALGKKIRAYIAKHPGRTPGYYAGKLGVSMPTLRKHVKGFVEKNGGEKESACDREGGKIR